MGWMAPDGIECQMVVVKDHQQWEPSMGDITTIGLDLAKKSSRFMRLMRQAMS
jgi:hypothetical protein